MGVLGAGLHSEERSDHCTANSKGLFAYYRVGRSGLRRSRAAWRTAADRAGPAPRASRTSRMIDAKALTDDRGEQGAQEPQGEGDRAGPLHGDSRAARQRALPVADDRHLQSERRWIRRRRAAAVRRRRPPAAAAGAPAAAAAVAVVAAAVAAAAAGGRGSVHGGQEGRRQDLQRPVHAEERHRQSASCVRRRSSATTRPAKPVTWVEKGVLKSVRRRTSGANVEHEPRAGRLATCRSTT